MSALILLNLSVKHNLKHSTVKIFCNEYLQNTFYKQSVDIFIMYLHIKFLILINKQLILDTLTDPVFFSLIIQYVNHMKRSSD